MSDGYTDAMLIDAQEQEITRLRAENEQMREIAQLVAECNNDNYCPLCRSNARAALGAEHE